MRRTYRTLNDYEMQRNAGVGLFTRPSRDDNANRNGWTIMTNILFSSWGDEVVDNRGKEPQSYVPVNTLELPEHFKQDEKIKGFMGWYGIVLRSDDVDIVDLCRSYMEAVHSNSCGKCIPCRTGTGIMVETLKRICRGEGHKEDLAFLEAMADIVSASSKCSIGQTGPIPLRHALKYFMPSLPTLWAMGTPSPPAHTIPG